MQTGTEHPNVTLVREAMQAFDRGDMEAYGPRCSDDIVWHQIGAPTLNGKDEMGENMPRRARAGASPPRSMTSSETTSTCRPRDAHATRPDGQTLDYRTTEIVHVKDGKVTERWAFSDDTQKIIDSSPRSRLLTGCSPR